MSPLLRSLFDSMLFHNLVFSSFLGSLLVILEAKSGKKSMKPAGLYGVVFFATALIGGLLLQTPQPFLYPLFVLLVGCIALSVLHRLHLVQGDWLGLPKTVVLITPIIGVQLMSGAYSTTNQILGSSLGFALGFTFAYVIVGAIREHVQLSESKKLFKTLPVVLFSMAMFSLIMSGFVFL
jgi:Na+-translocating ferredoxin:NAD+ oxidoreductase RnfA subunit